MSPRRRHRGGRRLVGAVTALLLVAVTSPSGHGPSPGVDTLGTPSGGWPLALTYDLRFREFSPDVQADLTFAQFELVADGWQAWRQVRTCCGEMAGQVIEFRPDGSVWEGGVLGGSVTQVASQEPGEGLVPLPDFAQRYPATRDDPAGQPFITVTGDATTGADHDGGLAAVLDVAGALGLKPEELISYDITSEVTRSRRVVFLSLNLTLSSEEWDEDDELIRSLEVTQIEFDAQPPFSSDLEPVIERHNRLAAELVTG